MLRIRMLWSLITGFILVLPSPVRALNPAHTLTQLGHSSWTLRGAQLSGYPKAVAQTIDGYLWIGTGFGLMRFDGVRLVAWQPPPAGAELPSSVVVSLLATSDGALWVGTTAGLARLADGVLSPVPQLAGAYVAALLQTRKGGIWAATATTNGNAALCSITKLEGECHDSNGSLGKYILSLQEDTQGNLWVGAASGLWRWNALERHGVEPGGGPHEIHSMVADERSILLSLSRNVVRFADGRFTPVLPVPIDGFKPTALLFDRHGSLWIGTQDQGVVRVANGQVERFTRAQGLSADFVANLMEDDEGNVWVGTTGGLDRFRDVAAARVPTKQGLGDDPVSAVQSGPDGSVWISTIGGLHRWKDGRVIMRPGRQVDGAGSLMTDRSGGIWVTTLNGVFVVSPVTGVMSKLGNVPAQYVHALVEDSSRSQWLSAQGLGLFHVRDGRLVALVPWSTFNGREARALAPDAHGGIWLGFVQGGLAYLRDGRLEGEIGADDGLALGAVNDLHAFGDELWVATQSGVSYVSGRTVRTMEVASGLPCASVHWVIKDDEGTLWLHTACGVVRIGHQELDRWLQGSSRLTLTTFDTADGILPQSDLGGYGRKVTKARDGRIWFGSYDGVLVIDPARLPLNTIPPPVHIENAVADGREYDVTKGQNLPPLVRDLRIDYTALSLVAPEKVRFRYKLEGRDRDWVEASARRQAFYTDLPPGAYIFRVVASNNQNTWNERGTEWHFRVMPVFYQTVAFRASIVAALCGLLWAAYRFRMRSVAIQFGIRFEERLAERTRIAHGLHDTLLQGFISSSMHLHLLSSEVADPQVKSKLAKILTRITEVIDEGRRTLSGLRTSESDDLEAALVRDIANFRNDSTIDVRVSVTGTKLLLKTPVRDSVYHIAREGLANAFRHAKATQIEAELEYSPTGFTVYIRDNGCGIDPVIVNAGRAGHWGLPTMRDRAEGIGVRLIVLSRLRTGTEITLRIPASIAFAEPELRGWRSLLRGRGSKRNASIDAGDQK